MVPMYQLGGSFSTTPLPTLKKWATTLNTMLHLNFPEALAKIQDVFAKLATGKKNSAKIQNTAKIQQDAKPSCRNPELGIGRGASKTRLVISNYSYSTTKTVD